MAAAAAERCRAGVSSPAFVVVLLGAESTGKTTLAHALGAALAARGDSVAVVDEALRDFCVATARTPRADEQSGLAARQSERIASAAARADVVIADTSALMIAVYSELVFGDTSLYDDALAQQQRYDLTLVTALDLPWQADGLQREGAHVRAPVDRLLRAALARAGIAFTTVAGQGEARSAAALRAIDTALAARPHDPPGARA
jgi:nicotinamide riboside kinase